MSSADPDEHSEPIAVASFATAGEAEVAKAKLAAYGIEAALDDQIEGGTVVVDGEPGVIVEVRRPTPRTPGASSARTTPCRVTLRPTSSPPIIVHVTRALRYCGVRFVDQLRSFQRRRIRSPSVPTTSCSTSAAATSRTGGPTCSLDRYIDAAHAGQRSGRKAARVSRPLFDADAAAMPFADRAFDYSVCSHVLEHVVDPGAVIDELVRVSKAGYIEVPEASSAKILDFPSHLWWVRLDGDTLVFTAKTERYHDAEIDAYIQRAGIEQRLADLLDADFDHRIVSLRWVGSVKYRVEGEVPQSLIDFATASGGHQRVGQTIAARLMTAVMTLPLRRIRRRAPILHDDVVAERHRTGTGEPCAARSTAPT